MGYSETIYRLKYGIKNIVCRNSTILWCSSFRISVKGISIIYPVSVINPTENGWSAALDFNAPFARKTNRVKRHAVGVSMGAGSLGKILLKSSGSQPTSPSTSNQQHQQRSRNRSSSDVSIGQATGNTVGGRRSFELKTMDEVESQIRTFTGNMDVSAISKTGRIWTFSPNTELLHPTNLENGQEVLLMAIWDGISKAEIEIAKNATVLYFDTPVADASCLVDRF